MFGLGGSHFPPPAQTSFRPFHTNLLLPIECHFWNNPLKPIIILAAHFIPRPTKPGL